MKYLIAIPLAFFAYFVAVHGAVNNESAAPNILYITNQHTAKTNFVSTNLFFNRCTVLGKFSDTDNNVSSVKVGTTNGQPYTVTSGGEYIIECSPGTKMNFKDFYLKCATIGDGLVVIFAP